MTHYICLENNQVVSVLTYQPNVPPDVDVVEITDVQHQLIIDGTHTFDVTSRKVVPIGQDVVDQLNQEKLNNEGYSFLSSTDWKVLRHLRQKALGVPTTLTDEEYLELEQQRQDAADSITN